MCDKSKQSGSLYMTIKSIIDAKNKVNINTFCGQTKALHNFLNGVQT